MRIENKTIQVEQTKRVYVSEDGMEFSSERDCLWHELTLHQDALKSRDDIIQCREADDFAPFNGGENYECHDYRWYKPTTHEAVEALCAAYPADSRLDDSDIGKWCCLEAMDDGYNFWTSINDDIVYVKDLCGLLGIEATFSEKPHEIFSDDVTGTLGEWLEADTSEIPAEAVQLLQKAYEICVKSMEVRA